MVMEDLKTIFERMELKKIIMSCVVFGIIIGAIFFFKNSQTLKEQILSFKSEFGARYVVLIQNSNRDIVKVYELNKSLVKNETSSDGIYFQWGKDVVHISQPYEYYRLGSTFDQARITYGYGVNKVMKLFKKGQK